MTGDDRPCRPRELDPPQGFSPYWGVATRPTSGLPRILGRCNSTDLMAIPTKWALLVPRCPPGGILRRGLLAAGVLAIIHYGVLSSSKTNPSQRIPEKRPLRLACRLKSTVVSCRPARRIPRRGFPKSALAVAGSPPRRILLGGRQETTLDSSRHASRRKRFWGRRQWIVADCQPHGVLCRGFLLEDDKVRP